MWREFPPLFGAAFLKFPVFLEVVVKPEHELVIRRTIDRS
jgi:hypothetical protein